MLCVLLCVWLSCHMTHSDTHVVSLWCHWRSARVGHCREVHTAHSGHRPYCVCKHTCRGPARKTQHIENVTFFFIAVDYGGSVVYSGIYIQIQYFGLTNIHIGNKIHLNKCRLCSLYGGVLFSLVLNSYCLTLKYMWCVYNNASF